jgi:hypothetical protein
MELKTKQMLRVDPENLGEIEELVQQWAILDEHYTQFNLNRNEQYEHGKRLYTRLMAEIKKAYATRESAYA